MEINNLMCCAVDELANLSSLPQQTPKALLYEVLTYMNDRGTIDIDEEDIAVHAAFVIFTQRSKGKYGDRLAAGIKQQGLGTVVTTPYKKNPNTGNRVKVFVWSIDQSRLKAYIKRLLKHNS